MGDGLAVNPLTNVCSDYSSCPTEYPWADSDSGFCVEMCPDGVFGDPNTMECVDLSSCPTGYYGDDTNNECVLPADCPTNTPYADPVSGSRMCVALEDCPDDTYGDVVQKECVYNGDCYTTIPYTDEKTRRCVVLSFFLLFFLLGTLLLLHSSFHKKNKDKCSSGTFADSSTMSCVYPEYCPSSAPYGDEIEKK